MIKFKFKTKYGFTTAIVEPIGKRIKFILSPLKGYRQFPIEVYAEYNKEILVRKHKASLVLVCDCNYLSNAEAIRLREKAMELLPVPPQAIDLVFERICKGDYSVVR
jgi:hypothetical protein